MALAKDLDIRFQTAVREINITGKQGIEVTYTDVTNPDHVELQRMKGKTFTLIA